MAYNAVRTLTPRQVPPSHMKPPLHRTLHPRKLSHPTQISTNAHSMLQKTNRPHPKPNTSFQQSTRQLSEPCSDPSQTPASTRLRAGEGSREWVCSELASEGVAVSLLHVLRQHDAAFLLCAALLYQVCALSSFAVLLAIVVFSSFRTRLSEVTMRACSYLPLVVLFLSLLACLVFSSSSSSACFSPPLPFLLRFSSPSVVSRSEMR